MTKQRTRELKSITAGIYVDVLNIMGTHKRGHVRRGGEETIVLAELARTIMRDVVDWSIEDNLDENEKE